MYLCGLVSPWGSRNGHQPLGRGNSLWRSACPILWSNPILKRYFMDIAPVYYLAQRLRNTEVPVWTHESMGYTKMDISYWDAAIHYGFHGVSENGHQPLGRGNSLWRSACPILWSNPILKRYFMDIAPVHSLPLRLRNSKEPVLTHDYIGYPKMDISHWDAAIHYGVQLA